ncbi:MAG: flagellar biosynthesis protein FlgJ [Micavibrio aeruginosavorus]|uniref:Flagellar biosynthesis protein FlgJ n=1 Tax=Micavibrio aeruginosavorus TaxID=349221 RepID=A0A2W5MSD0_9BACT|nr:MAG: flagellar biosynthesis protein FlgJ [Micavibrio aeruginosavorus]
MCREYSNHVSRYKNMPRRGTCSGTHLETILMNDNKNHRRTQRRKMAQESIYNKALDAYNVPKNVYNAIKNAAAKTGVNFSYLLEKAAVESSFDTNAKAKTSSATGLYQFIESTWLTMVKEHGDKYGLEKYAAKIDDNNRVSDSKTRREILNLRKDPEIASLMAAEFDTGNYEQLKSNVGGDIGKTELYLAHFMGAGGASGFLNAMKKSPNMVAADIFPKEARANRNIFYDKTTGAPRSLSQVYALFDNKFQGSASGDVIQTAANDASTRALAQNAYAGSGTRNNAQAVAVQTEEDPFTRLASLMSTTNSYKARNYNTNNDSVLRLSSADNGSSRDGWQILPPSRYNSLSLSPAQMMMLSSFNA